MRVFDKAIRDVGLGLIQVQSARWMLSAESGRLKPDFRRVPSLIDALKTDP
jgi:hypothetical protein